MSAADATESESNMDCEECQDVREQIAALQAKYQQTLEHFNQYVAKLVNKHKAEIGELEDKHKAEIGELVLKHNAMNSYHVKLLEQYKKTIKDVRDEREKYKELSQLYNSELQKTKDELKDYKELSGCYDSNIVVLKKERDKLKAEIEEVTKERNQIRNELTAAFF